MIVVIAYFCSIKNFVCMSKKNDMQISKTHLKLRSIKQNYTLKYQSIIQQ